MEEGIWIPQGSGGDGAACLYNFYLSVCMRVSSSVEAMCVQGLSRPQRVSDSLEQESQVVVSHPKGLGTKLRSFGRAGSTLNH